MATNGQPELEVTVDVGAQRIARTYAEALLNAAQKQNRADEVLDELDSLVNDLFRKDPYLETFLSSSAVGRDKKKGMIELVFGTRASAAFTNFLLVLNNHDRLGLLRAILIEAREIHEDRTGKVRVQVHSAVPLADDQRERLLKQLRDSLKREPVLHAQVDPSLLGGIVVRVGDWVYDASVRTRLDILRNQLVERSSHEIQSRRDRFCSPN
jgi:F-type H+-transporting ATPase subunit delta